jgi:hypothetical protein
MNNEGNTPVSIYEQTVENLKLAEVIKAVNKPERKKRTTKESSSNE